MIYVYPSKLMIKYMYLDSNSNCLELMDVDKIDHLIKI